jgi:hypothetical protein
LVVKSASAEKDLDILPFPCDSWTMPGTKNYFQRL